MCIDSAIRLGSVWTIIYIYLYRKEYHPFRVVAEEGIGGDIASIPRIDIIEACVLDQLGAVRVEPGIRCLVEVAASKGFLVFISHHMPFPDAAGIIWGVLVELQ